MNIFGCVYIRTHNACIIHASKSISIQASIFSRLKVAAARTVGNEGGALKPWTRDPTRTALHKDR